MTATTKTMAILTTMRVVGGKESKGNKEMVIATRVMGKQTAMATKRVMATAMREAGEEEGNGKGGKSNHGKGNEEGDGKHPQQP